MSFYQAMSSYQAMDYDNVDNATPQPSESFMASKKVLIVLGLSAALGVAGVATFQNSVSPNVITDLSGIDEANVAQWQGTTKQKKSWTNFGKPPTLTSLNQSEWKECSAYTVSEKAELDAYATYWGTRLDGDQPLREHLEHMVDEHGMSNSTKKGKSIKELYGCTYYSAGLSGPLNGIQPDSAEFYTFMQTHGKDRRLHELTETASCTSSSSYWECEISWDYSVTILSTSSITFSLKTSSCTFEFDLDIANCDADADIGGSVYLSFTYDGSVTDYDYTYNLWDAPTVDSSYKKIDLEFEYSVFTLDVNFVNTIYDSTGYKCCFNSWDASITPGVDISIYSKSVDISLGHWTIFASDNSECDV